MPGTHVTPDTLSVEWRIALGVARDALVADANTPTPALADAELHARTLRLANERDEVEQLLEAEARAQHVRLVRRLALPTAAKHDLRLPADVTACLFDLDGVLTTSADLHFAASTGSRRFLEAAAATGLATAVASGSANTGAMLEQAGLSDLVDAQVDGAAMVERALRPRPAPDTLLAACERLGTAPRHAAAFETTAAGLEAARAAAVRFVVHVARDGDEPVAPGLADVTVGDLGELLQPTLRGAA